MNRRQTLSLLATLTAGTFAGCLGDDSDDQDGSDDDEERESESDSTDTGEGEDDLGDEIDDLPGELLISEEITTDSTWQFEFEEGEQLHIPILTASRESLVAMTLDGRNQRSSQSFGRVAGPFRLHLQ